MTWLNPQTGEADLWPVTRNLASLRSSPDANSSCAADLVTASWEALGHVQYHTAAWAYATLLGARDSQMHSALACATVHGRWTGLKSHGPSMSGCTPSWHCTRAASPGAQSAARGQRGASHPDMPQNLLVEASRLPGPVEARVQQRPGAQQQAAPLRFMRCQPHLQQSASLVGRMLQQVERGPAPCWGQQPGQRPAAPHALQHLGCWQSDGACVLVKPRRGDLSAAGARFLT